MNRTTSPEDVQRAAPIRFVTHSKKVQRIAAREGWLPGARYTNLRDVKALGRLGFLDIDWKRYDFDAHLAATKRTRPILTVARDIEDQSLLTEVLEQAHRLQEFSQFVAIVPKDPRMASALDSVIPDHFVLGFSVTSSYGGTAIDPSYFRRPVHLLGGRPDVQRRLAQIMPVFSFDCNRFTLDAAYGDYFDGQRFRRHPRGGYDRCLRESIRNINRIWEDYSLPGPRVTASVPFKAGASRA
jgi:hypothetical protein